MVTYIDPNQPPALCISMFFRDLDLTQIHWSTMVSKTFRSSGDPRVQENVRSGLLSGSNVQSWLINRGVIQSTQRIRARSATHRGPGFGSGPDPCYDAPGRSTYQDVLIQPARLCFWNVLDGLGMSGPMIDVALWKKLVNMEGLLLQNLTGFGMCSGCNPPYGSTATATRSVRRRHTETTLM